MKCQTLNNGGIWWWYNNNIQTHKDLWIHFYRRIFFSYLADLQMIKPSHCLQNFTVKKIYYFLAKPFLPIVFKSDFTNFLHYHYLAMFCADTICVHSGALHLILPSGSTFENNGCFSMSISSSVLNFSFFSSDLVTAFSKIVFTCSMVNSLCALKRCRRNMVGIQPKKIKTKFKWGKNQIHTYF